MTQVVPSLFPSQVSSPVLPRVGSTFRQRGPTGASVDKLSSHSHSGPFAHVHSLTQLQTVSSPVSPASPKKEKAGGGPRYELLQTLGTGTYGQVFLCRKSCQATTLTSGGSSSSSSGPYSPASSSTPSMGSPNPSRKQSQRRLLANSQEDDAPTVVVENSPAPKPYAVKVANKEAAYRRSALNESKVLQLLASSPETVRWVETYEENGHICIVTELLTKTVYEVMKQREFAPMPMGDVRAVTTNVARSLAALHRLGYMHCDVKPENVMLRSLQEGMQSACLIDFGAVRALHENAYFDIQSLWYRAPEVLCSVPYTPKIDSWSLGCLIFELATGSPLFPGTSASDELMRIVDTMGAPSPQACASIPSSSLRASVSAQSFSPQKVGTRGKAEKAIDERIYGVHGRDKQVQALVSLLHALLSPDESQRISCEEALSHPFLRPSKSHPLKAWGSAATPTSAVNIENEKSAPTPATTSTNTNAVTRKSTNSVVSFTANGKSPDNANSTNYKSEGGESDTANPNPQQVVSAKALPKAASGSGVWGLNSSQNNLSSDNSRGWESTNDFTNDTPSINYQGQGTPSLTVQQQQQPQPVGRQGVPPPYASFSQTQQQQQQQRQPSSVSVASEANSSSSASTSVVLPPPVSMTPNCNYSNVNISYNNTKSNNTTTASSPQQRYGAPPNIATPHFNPCAVPSPVMNAYVGGGSYRAQQQSTPMLPNAMMMVPAANSNNNNTIVNTSFVGGFNNNNSNFGCGTNTLLPLSSSSPSIGGIGASIGAAAMAPLPLATATGGNTNGTTAPVSGLSPQHLQSGFFVPSSTCNTGNNSNNASTYYNTNINTTNGMQQQQQQSGCHSNSPSFANSVNTAPVYVTPLFAGHQQQFVQQKQPRAQGVSNLSLMGDAAVGCVCTSSPYTQCTTTYPPITASTGPYTNNNNNNGSAQYVSGGSPTYSQPQPVQHRLNTCNNGGGGAGLGASLPPVMIGGQQQQQQYHSPPRGSSSQLVVGTQGLLPSPTNTTTGTYGSNWQQGFGYQNYSASFPPASNANGPRSNVGVSNSPANSYKNNRNNSNVNNGIVDAFFGGESSESVCTEESGSASGSTDSAESAISGVLPPLGPSSAFFAGEGMW